MNIERIAGALAFALLIAVLARRRLPAWCVGALFITPVVFLLADENFRIFSYHGLTHYSIVYGLIERGPPPTIPLLAGEPLFYPYGLHYMIAQAMRLIPLAPPWFFAGINIASLVATIAIVDRIARLFSPDRDYRTLCTALALSGWAALVMLQEAREVLEGVLPLSGWRPITPILKFTVVNANQVGLVGFTLALLYASRILVAEHVSLRAGIGVFAVLTGLGFIYPFTWLAALVAMGVAVVLLLANGNTTSAIRLGTTSAVASICVLPWLLGLSLGRGDLAAPSLLTPGLAERSVIAVCVLLPPLVLLGVERRWRTSQEWTRTRSLWIFHIACAGALSLGYLLVHLPLQPEYKFLLAAQIPLAFLVAHSLRTLLHRRFVLATLVLWFVVLAPASSVRPFMDPGRYGLTTDGRQVVPRDLERRALYGWVVTETPPDAVFVAVGLDIPSLGHRELLGALARGRSDLMGWTFRPQQFIGEVWGASLDLLAERQAWTVELLAEGPPPTDALLDRIIASVAPRPVYVIATGQESFDRLSSHPRLAVRFGTRRETILQILDRDT